MSELGKVLVILGLLIAVAGVLLCSGAGRGWLGRLPGDFHYSRGGTSFYFPLMTCVLLSVFLSVLLWLFRKF
jgi:hypothetical protein